ncbi:MAG: hypothetical protein HKO65_00025 [Gemmatimonadetes bacterium]|nr:hypothetical protein [Gemmatimonadota bacterium]NNM03459.1 hypothetical protein [Gemmatimonadota bacterium]
MRVFRDDGGNRWDVVVGRESWGTVVAIFVVQEGAEAPRETMMKVRSPEEGTRELMAMTEEELGDLFTRSAAKPSE